MRTTSDDLRERQRAAIRECRAQGLGEEETGRRLLEIDPEYPPGLLALGSARLAADDLDAAEPLFWRALAGAPANPGYYFPLAALYRARGDEGMVNRFLTLAFSKLSFYDEVPKGLAAAIAKAAPSLAAEAGPEAYEEAAEVFAAGAPGPWPERLLPFHLLNETQRGAGGGLDPDVVREIVANGASCAPVFEAAVREVYDTESSSLSVESESLVTALLGEIGGVELMDGLLRVEDDPIDLYLHSHWALRRLGQRFPAEALARLRAAAAGADADLRATIAQHLYFLPESVGAAGEIPGMLDGFDGSSEAAAYLLLTVSTLQAMTGQPNEAKETLKRYERQLPKEGRRWAREAIESEQGFLPDLIAEGIDELDVDAICVDLALMTGPEPDLEDDDEFDELEEPEAAVKPGRNDPCWCGSGKKYKKCHLHEDEERARGERPHEPEGSLFDAAWGQLLDAASHYHSSAETKRAVRLFTDRDPAEVRGDALAELGFFEWYVLDYRPESTGRTVVEEFLRRRGPRLTEGAHELMESWAGSRYGLWEVVRTEGDRGVEVRDVFEGDSVFVENAVNEKQLAAGDFLIHRICRFEDRWQFLGQGFLVQKAAAGRIRAEVGKGGGEKGAYFRSRSHEWRRFVLEEQADDAG